MITSISDKKLKNPPIKEVVLAISFEKFLTMEQIEEFSNNICNELNFPKQTKADGFQLNIKPDDTNLKVDNIKRMELENEENKQKLIIEPYRIIYYKGGKYTKFDDFYSPVQEIYKLFPDEKNIKICNIGLRYVNMFALSFDNVANHLDILPVFNAKNASEQDYAVIQSYMTLLSILSPEESNIGANVRFTFNASEDRKFNIVFDIDTYYNAEQSIGSFGDVAKICKDLRIFKNGIFFQNIMNIDKIEEFK